MPKSAATRGNKESGDDASIDEAVMYASYQVRTGSFRVAGRPCVGSHRLELKQFWSAALRTLPKTALRVSKLEQA